MLNYVLLFLAIYTHAFISVRWCIFSLSCVNVFFQSSRCFSPTKSLNLDTIFGQLTRNILFKETANPKCNTVHALLHFHRIIKLRKIFHSHFSNIYYRSVFICKISFLSPSSITKSNHTRCHTAQFKRHVCMKNISTGIFVPQTFCSFSM